jgi:hypothetical protein
MTADPLSNASRPTGIAPLDQTWGGLQPGRAYVLFGRGRNGRHLLTLQLAQTGVLRGENVLFVSSRQPQELLTEAQSFDFDLKAAAESGALRLLRIPASLLTGALTDDALEDAIGDLVDLLHEHRPAWLVLDDFTPFVQFQAFSRFEDALGELLQGLQAAEAVGVLATGEAANEQSQRILGTLREQSAGAVRIARLREGKLCALRFFATADSPGDPIDVLWDPNKPAALVTDEDAERAATAPLPPPKRAAPSAAPPRPDALSAIDTGAYTLPQPLHLPGNVVDEGIVVDSDVAGGLDPFGTPLPPLPKVYSDRSRSNGIVEVPDQSSPDYRPPGYNRRNPMETGMVDGPTNVVDAAPLPMPSAPRHQGSVTQAAFRKALAHAFMARATQHEPFLVLSLHIDPSHPHAKAFGQVQEGIRTGLPPDGTFVADVARYRLVVLLPGSGPGAARNLLTHIKQRLHVDGQEGDAVLESFSALVIPNGRPFQDPKALMAYAMGEG